MVSKEVQKTKKNNISACDDDVKGVLLAKYKELRSHDYTVARYSESYHSLSDLKGGEDSNRNLDK